MNSESSSKPEPLTDNLLRLPHYEPMTERIGMATSCYALLCDKKMVLVDAVFADVLPQVQALDEAGHKPIALIFSHRHVVAQAEVLPEFLREFDVPIFLHPHDAAHPQARRWSGFQFADPTNNSLLAACGIETKLFAGHTEGSVLILQNEGVTVIAGDCATGATAHEAEAEDWTLIRPPIFFNVDDDQLRRNWLEFETGTTTTIAPYHGLPVVNDAERVLDTLRSLRKPEPTTRLGGEDNLF